MPFQQKLEMWDLMLKSWYVSGLCNARPRCKIIDGFHKVRLDVQSHWQKRHSNLISWRSYCISHKMLHFIFLCLADADEEALRTLRFRAHAVNLRIDCWVHIPLTYLPDNLNGPMNLYKNFLAVTPDQTCFTGSHLLLLKGSPPLLSSCRKWRVLTAEEIDRLTVSSPTHLSRWINFDNTTKDVDVRLWLRTAERLLKILQRPKLK